MVIRHSGQASPSNWKLSFECGNVSDGSLGANQEMATKSLRDAVSYGHRKEKSPGRSYFKKTTWKKPPTPQSSGQG